MTDNTKSTTSKKNKTIARKPKPTPDTGFRLKKSEWLVVPLGILVIICLYAIVGIISSTGYVPPLSLDAFMRPDVASVIVGLFGSLYTYKILKKERVHKIATVVAYVFSVVLLLAAVALIATSSSGCTGLYGVQESCSDVYNFKLYLLLFNPFVAWIWSPLAVIGGAALFVKPKSQR